MGHDRVLGRRHQFDAHGVIVARHVIGIGGIDHQEHMRRQSGAQPLDLVEGQIRAGRIVRIGEPYELGARRNQLQDRVDVGGVVGLRCDDVDAPARPGRDRIHQEAVGGADRFVAMAEKGVRQQVEQLIGTGAADDAGGIEPENAADRFAQHPRTAFRIVMQMARGLPVDLDRLRRRPERRLIGRQLEYLAPRLRHRAFARRIGCDIENAGVRHRTGHLQLRIIGTALRIWRPHACGVNSTPCYPRVITRMSNPKRTPKPMRYHAGLGRDPSWAPHSARRGCRREPTNVPMRRPLSGPI